MDRLGPPEHAVDLTTDGAGSPQVIAGGDGISVAQPQFADDGTLWFISDESGWWNLHRWDGGHATRVHPVDADLAQPQWVLGMVDYALLPDGRALLVGMADANLTPITP